MQTLQLTHTETDLIRAAELLKTGNLVAIPTETVYGLAADALNGKAVASIFAAKGRPMDNPLIVHIASMNELGALVGEIPETALALAAAYWPGPLTMIFKKSERIPREVSAGLQTVAVRMPLHPVARRIIELSGCPLAAPSANRSGSPSPTDAARVMQDLNGRVSAVVDGGSCAVGVESTVIDISGKQVRLLRPGAVTVEMLEAVVGKIEVDEAVRHQLKEGAKAASPGMKYKHYAPTAQVILVKGSSKAYADYVNANAKDGVAALCFEENVSALKVPAFVYGSCADAASQAHGLFDALRRLDDAGMQTAYAISPAEDGIGLAVYNRLLRAAGFEVIELE